MLKCNIFEFLAKTDSEVNNVKSSGFYRYCYMVAGF